MRLQAAIAPISELAGRLQPGLAALTKTERVAVEPQDSKRLRGSLELDSALRATFPNANRWDYAVAYQHASRSEGDEDVYWIEFHSAHDHGATEVLRKVRWLKEWLAGEGKHLAFPGRRSFTWIASGKISMTRNSQRARQLAKERVDFPIKHLNIADQKS
jgi:hypothetical protein